MTRAVLFGVAGVVVVGTAGFMAGRLSVTDLSMVQLVEPEYRTKVAELEEWSVGPRTALSKAEWRQRYGDDVALAARRVMEGLAATSYPDIEAIYNAHQFARNLSLEQVKEALAEVEGASRPEAAMAMEAALLNQWASLDGEGALAYALARNDNHRDSLVHAGLSGWVRHDPEGARDWYQENSGSLKVSPFFGSLLDGIVFGGLARTDMPGALAGVGDLEWPRREQVVRAIAGQVYHDASKRTELLDRVGEFEDGELLLSAQEALMASWSRHDPEAAAGFLAGLKLSAEARAGLESQLMGMWSRSDPRGALEWKLAGAASAGARQEALASHFGTWLVNEEAAASEWLAGQPEELQSDRVFQSAALALSVERPERALTWAEQIINAGMRTQVLSEIYSGWKSYDPGAAEEWLAGQDEETRTLLAGEPTGEAPPETGSTEAIVEALENELRALENATGLTPDQIAAKREQLQLLLDSFSGREGVPVDTAGE